MYSCPIRGRLRNRYLDRGHLARSATEVRPERILTRHGYKMGGDPFRARPYSRLRMAAVLLGVTSASSAYFRLPADHEWDTNTRMVAHSWSPADGEFVAPSPAYPVILSSLP